MLLHDFCSCIVPLQCRRPSLQGHREPTQARLRPFVHKGLDQLFGVYWSAKALVLLPLLLNIDCVLKNPLLVPGQRVVLSNGFNNFAQADWLVLRMSLQDVPWTHHLTWRGARLRLKCGTRVQVVMPWRA